MLYKNKMQEENWIGKNAVGKYHREYLELLNH